MNGWAVLGLWFGGLLVMVGVVSMAESGRLARVAAAIADLRSRYTMLGGEQAPDVLTGTVERSLLVIEHFLTPWWVTTGRWVRDAITRFVAECERMLPRWVWFVLAAALLFSLGAAVGDTTNP